MKKKIIKSKYNSIVDCITISAKALFNSHRLFLNTNLKPLSTLN